MQQIHIKPSKISGRIIASPSKSHTLRAILFASLAKGTSTISNYLKSPDAVAMIHACQAMGAKITQEDHTLTIQGFNGIPDVPDDVIDCGNSGQVLRFALAVSAITSGYSVFTGDHSIRHNRPMQPMIEALTGLGAQCISTKGDGYAPIIVKGPITPGTTILDGQDSQPVSGLLIACAFLPGETKIQVSNPGEQAWIGVTLHWLDRLGIQYTHNNFRQYTLKGNSQVGAFNYTVPGDFSSMAYLIVAAVLTNAELTITHVDMNDCQGDKVIVDILIEMGANIKIDIKQQQLYISPGSQLKGREIDINACIDALPILAVVGCYAQGSTHLYNASVARKKESDRLSTITSELKKMDASIEEYPDSLLIHQSSLSGATTQSHHDHRIAMSIAVATLAASSGSIIDNTNCIKKSYPSFISDFKNLGADIEEKLCA
jgi:3-phosphoshikimate 1-carboxyvinyltransferase